MRSLIALSFAVLLTSDAFAAPEAFGKPLKGLAPTTLAAVLEKPENGKVIALEGAIKAACKEKGCWLTFTQGNQSIHVTFEGYSFFVPKDSAGQKVKLEGKVVVKERSRAEIEHLKGDGAEDASSPVSIEATGVVIERPAK